MKRRVRIVYEPGSMTCKATYYQVNSDGSEIAGPEIDYSTWTREQSYGNQLYNGELEVIEANGVIHNYGDGCHLVETEGMVRSMSKPDYEAWTGRPGSGNED